MNAIAEKMHSIAEELGELSAYGKVKCFSGNEKGYAKILQIKPGCSIWAHYTLDDELIIDLIATETAQVKYPDIVKETTAKFRSFFHQETIAESWQHSIDIKNKGMQHYFPITETPLDQIFQIIEELTTYMKT